MYSSKPKLSFLAQIGIFFGLLIAAFIIVAIVQAGFLFSVVNFKDLLNGNTSDDQLKGLLLNPSNKGTLLLMQVISTFVVFFLPAYFFAKIVHGKPFVYLGLTVKSNKIQIGIVVILAFVGLLLSGALGEVNELIPISASLEKKFRAWEAEYQAQVLAIATIKNFGDYIIALIVIAALPAFFEELLFRGVMQQLFENSLRSGWLSIIITGFIFSAIHTSYYGFLPRWGLGIILGLVFFYSRNLWLSVLLHFLNNAVAVTALYYANIKGTPLQQILDEKFPIWIGAIALVVVVFLLKKLYAESVSNGTHQIDNTEPNVNYVAEDSNVSYHQFDEKLNN